RRPDHETQVRSDEEKKPQQRRTRTFYPVPIHGPSPFDFQLKNLKAGFVRYYATAMPSLTRPKRWSLGRSSVPFRLRTHEKVKWLTDIGSRLASAGSQVLPGGGRQARTEHH